MKSFKQGMRRGTICQQKVYERGTFIVKSGIYKEQGVGPRGGATPYKHLLSIPLPPGQNRTQESSWNRAYDY